MNILISNHQKDLPLSSSSVRKMISFLLQNLGVVCDEVSVHFVSSARICALHEDFFDDPTVTDCISFPIDPPCTDPSVKQQYQVLGEIFICPKTALIYARQHKKDPYEETSLYVVHGLLHLMGYDDLEPKARKKMRQKEKTCLALLRKNTLLLTKKRLYKTR